MKTMKKIISILCVAVMLVSSMGVLSAFAATYSTPVVASHWEDPVFSTDHAYSFAFVGDTQFITIGDALGVTSGQLEKQYIRNSRRHRELYLGSGAGTASRRIPSGGVEGHQGTARRRLCDRFRHQ